jgi:lipopolysaccharide transport system permease protein
MSRPADDPIVTVLRPPDHWPGFGLRELWLTRRIIFVLVQRMLLVRYRQAVLGFAWIIIQPLVLTIIITVFLGLILGDQTRYGLPFPVFLFSAWLVWRPFQRVLMEGSKSIEANGSLVKRVDLPRAVFPISISIATMVDLLSLALALVVMLMVYSISPGIGLLTMPILVAIMYAAGLGAAFFFSASSLRYADMEFVVQLLAQAWFWGSPIIYPSTAIPEPWRTLYYFNPMVVVIEGTRWAFTQTPMPPLEAWLIGGASAAAMLISGYMYFRRRESVFADLI